MPETLYDSPDVQSIDYMKTVNSSNARRPASIDNRFVATKVNMANDAQEVIQGLSGLIRKDDIKALGDGLTLPDGDSIALSYLTERIPNIGMYLQGLSEDATDEEKIELITLALKDRAKRIDEYNARTPQQAPFLGNDVEEARSKQDGADISTRYKTQYQLIPGYGYVNRRGAINSPYYRNQPQRRGSRTNSGGDITPRFRGA